MQDKLGAQAPICSNLVCGILAESLLITYLHVQ